MDRQSLRRAIEALIPLLACLIVLLTTAVFLSVCQERQTGPAARLSLSCYPPHFAAALRQLREDYGR